jgi:hypothetical protein
MVSCGKTLTLTLVTLFLTLALLIPSMTNAQTTGPYGDYMTINGITYDTGVFYYLTMYSPNNQTVYDNTMLLNFTLDWTYDLLPIGNSTPSEDYAYSIDDNPLVSIAPNQTAGPNNFNPSSSFSYLLNVSILTNGYHKIVIFARYYLVGSKALLDKPSSPITFLVEHPPNITIFSPQNQSYTVANVSLSSIPLNFTVDKPTAWIAYSLDNQNNMTVAGNSTLTELTYGLHTLVIYANDTFGNTGSQTINFTVEKPQIEAFGSTMTVAIIVVPVAIVCIAVGLLVYRKKHKH